MGSSTTKLAIAEAAAQEFAARGYAGTSMAGIASRLGLTKGALVYHFPAKADFVTYFVEIIHNATRQAQEFCVGAYPKNGAKRLVLFSLIMEHWRKNYGQINAGTYLFTDSSAPHPVAEELSRHWLAFYVDALELCKERGELRKGITPFDAAEILVVTNLGATFFGQLFRDESDDVKPLRFLRKALRSVGVPRADKITDRVLKEHSNCLPAPAAVAL